MNHKSLFALLLLVLALSCTSKNNQQENAEAKVTTSTGNKLMSTSKDTLSLITSARHASDSTTTSAITIAYPVQNRKNAALVRAINEWISEQLGGTYGADADADYEKLLSDTAAISNHYFAAISKAITDRWREFSDDFEPGTRPEVQFLDSVGISKMAEGENWVTMQYVNMSYFGGAHGSYTIFGQTFRKSDGRRIGWEIFRQDPESNLQDLMRKELVNYFNQGDGTVTEDNLQDYLQGEASAYYLPMPQCQPLFTNEGILFLYNQYEIASYAEGLPQFVLSYDQLMPMLNVTAKRLISK